MLKYSANCKKLKITDEVLNTSDIVLYGDSALTFSVEKCADILPSSIITFYRKDGSRIEHYEEKLVNEFEYLGDSGYALSLPPISDIDLEIVSAYTKTISEMEYVFFRFNKPHHFNTNREDNPIKKSVENHLEEESLCPGDTFTYKEYFIYLKNDRGSTCINANCLVFFQDILGQKYAKQGIVPCTIQGVDMEQTVMFEYDSVIGDILSNYSSVKCWIKDCRFFNYRQVVSSPPGSPYLDSDYRDWYLELKPGASIRLRLGDPIFSFVIDNAFSPYLLANDGISQYLEEEAEKKITAALDYEKQQFVPVVFANNTYYDVSKISFYIHLRERDSDWNVIPDGRWMYMPPPAHPEYNHYYYGDYVIGKIFNNDDVYYQRKCVSETFLRISFYNSVDRGTQKLLYTAKLYLDENRLWSEYIRYKSRGMSPTSEILKFRFICTNKYDYNNKTEGFYLHLFPGNIKELADGGYIYAKFELCMAKYGKTIPLTAPLYPNTSQEIFDYYGTSSLYFKSDATNGQRIDMEKLNNDMYVKIKIKFHKGRYVWYFDGANKEKDAENLEIKLYEPKLYGSGNS